MNNSFRYSDKGLALTKSFDHLVQRRMATDAACDRCVIIDAPGGGRSRRDGAFDG